MTAEELKLDYFKFYDIENREVGADITLRGQFDKRAQKMRLRLLDYFANPVSKNREPLLNKNAHLAWFRGAQAPEDPRDVVVENQFGKFKIRIGTGVALLAPTEKVEAGSAFPEDLSHFKVYPLLDEAEVPKVELTLRDQWGSEETKLGAVRFFAVPVVKRAGEKSYPIRNDRAHLLIYAIPSREVRDRKVRLRNQFVRGTSARVVRSLMLAAPSLKLEWK